MRTSHTRRVLRALISANRRFNKKRSWVMCSHVAMSMLLALFTFLLFVVALAGALTEDVHAEEFIQLVIGGWPDEIADPIAGEVRAVMSSQTGGLLTLGAVLVASRNRKIVGDYKHPMWMIIFGIIAVVITLIAGFMSLQGLQDLWTQ